VGLGPSGVVSSRSLEAAADNARVTDSVSEVAATQVILTRPEIVPPMRQCETAGVPRHVARLMG
jgi:hypothetical protein